MLKMCLNPKVLIGLAATGVAVYLIAPNLIVAALPLLILAACPLSMLLMGGAMMGGGHAGKEGVGRGSEPTPSPDAAHPPSSEEEVRELRAEIRTLGDRQAALLDEVEWLRRSDESNRPPNALTEAEEIARSASRD